MRWGIVFILLLGTALPASAASVYLNGVKIDGVTNQEFKGCTVKIDAHGNIHIEARGYAVKGAKAANGQTPRGKVGDPVALRYWLVTEKSQPGRTQFDIDIFINNVWVRKLLDEEEHIVFDITKYLKVGPNRVHFLAKKTVGDSGPVSVSPEDFFRVVIGPGDSGGRNVVLSKKLVDYRRTADEQKDFNELFKIVAE